MVHFAAATARPAPVCATPFARPARPLIRLSAIAAVMTAAFSGTTVHAQGTASEPVVRLGDVVISAAGFEQEIVQAPASITVITREQLEQQQIRNLADAVRGIQGVNVNALDARDGKTGNPSISLRGLPREYTLILIDGIRQNPMGNITPNSFNDSQSAFIPPVAAIERIEIIRGPMATLYGSDALGGVVNIITRKPGDEWRGAASIGHTFQSDSDFGSRSTVEGYAAGPLSDTLSLQLYGRVFNRARSDIDVPGVERPRATTADTPTMGQNPVRARNYTAGGKLLLTPQSAHELSLAFNVTRQDYDNRRGDIGALSRTGNPEASACNSTPAPNFCRGYGRELEFNRDQITLGYTGRFDAGMLETRLTRDYLETKGRTIPLGSGLDPAREGSARKLELETWILDARYITGVGSHLITIGGQYIDPKMTDGLWGGTSNRVRQHSLFVEDEWSLTDTVTLTGGLRYDNNDAYSAQWTPRVAAVWNATENWTIKGGIGQGFRTPYLEQLTDGIIGFGNLGTEPLYGNPNLKPERATNYEVSALYTNARLSAQATLFHNRLKDLIEAGTGANTGTSLNVGRARIQGIELDAAWLLAQDWRVSANYTYTDSKVTKTQQDTGALDQRIASRKGDPLVSVPKHMFNARVDWQATPRLGTFLSAEYRSKAFRPRNYHEPQTGGNSQGQVESGWRDSRIVLGDFRGYTLFNLGASYRLTDRVSLNGVIYNLLDKDFNRYTSYTRCANGGCTSSAEGFSNRYNNILEPRRLFVSLNAEF